MTNFQLKFGEPKHGWLPVDIRLPGDKIIFESSDVPNNPIADLIEALWKASRGETAEVLWHEEPGGYIFSIKPELTGISILICSIEDIDYVLGSGSRVERASFRGSPNDTLLPMWLAINEFAAHNFEEPHWPTTDYGELDKLRSSIEQM